MSEQPDRETLAWIKRYQKSLEAAEKKLADDINRAFFSLMRMHIEKGRDVGTAAQMACDDMNGAWRKP